MREGNVRIECYSPEETESLNQPIETWDVNGVTPMAKAFYIGEIFADSSLALEYITLANFALGGYNERG